MRTLQSQHFSFADERRASKKPRRWPVSSSFIEIAYGYVVLFLYAAAMFLFGADFDTLSPMERKAWLIGALLVMAFAVLTSCAVTRERRSGG
jgi:hypothetical protein